MSAQPSPAVAPPAAFATQRNPANASMGARVAAVANALGTPLMPWQRQVVDVALELDPEHPGEWRYPVVVITVPRQSGKTTLARAIAVDRMLSAPARHIFMTAQQGKDAVLRWRDLVEGVEASPLGSKTPAGDDRIEVYRGATAPTLTWLANRSFIRSFAPTRTGIHGETANLVMVDEFWAFNDETGEALEAGIGPALLVPRDSQRIFYSTAGTAESTYMRRMVDAGRRAMLDPDARMAYFEWSADPERDTYDEAGWAFHPAIGHTITLRDIRAEADPERNTRANFERGYLNRWTVASEAVLDVEQHDARRGDPAAVVTGTPVAGFEVAHDRSSASVWVAWRDGDTTHLRVSRTEAGTSWLPEHLRALADAGAQLACDDYVTNRPIVRALAETGHEVRTLTQREWVDACAAWRARSEDGTHDHDGSPSLRAAVEAVRDRTAGADGGRCWSRRDSAAPIDALSAATVAGYVAATAVTTIQLFV